ncbi:MAG: penicillin-binding protein 2 [Acidimicrobiales bacterium]
MTLERRFAVVGWLAAGLFFVLIGRVWFLQVISSPQLTEVAAGNRTREIVSESARGKILDVNGTVIAGLRESLVVTLDWSGLRHLDNDERVALLADAAHEMNTAGVKIKAADLEAVYERAKTRSLQPVIVADDVPVELWVTLQERAFPGVVAERRSLRTYPYNEVAAHLIGYIGRVQDQDEADELNEVDDAKPYQPGDEIGRSGLEAEFDRVLRGTPERRLVEVNARNEVVRTIEVLQPGEPGSNLHLTIDVHLQAEAERTLQYHLLLAQRRPPCEDCPDHLANAGSIVITDVTDGSLVAAASYPAFVPGDFLYGMTQAQADYLFQSADQPFVNRSVAGLYAPGSTFKPFSAYGAITTGVRTPDDVWNDEGKYQLISCEENPGGGRCVFQNAKAQILGEVQLVDAISRSSDTYFYSLGEELWLDTDTFGVTPVQDAAEAFGFGTPTGLRLGIERSGRVPTPERRKADHDRNPEAFPNDQWFVGDNVNLAIGQGDLLVTPIQLANAYAMIAADGTQFETRLVQSITNGESERVIQSFEPLVSSSIALNAETMEPIKLGLEGATVTGTAKTAFAGFPQSIGVAGKTGTAQVAGKADYALFAGYGPLNEPKYAISVILEQAGFGGDAAAPAARTMFDYLIAGEIVPERVPFADPEPIVLPPETDENGNLVNEFGQRIDVLGNVLTPEQIATLDAAPAPEQAAAPTPPPPSEEPATTP